MIFLSKLDNMTLCRAVCYPDDEPRLNRNSLLMIPTADENVLLKMLDMFKMNKSRLRFKGVNYMYFPKYYNFKAGIKTVRYHDENFNAKMKELKDISKCAVTYTNGVIRDYNVVMNYVGPCQKLMDPKVQYNQSNSMTIWDALLNSQGLPHKHKYIIITPEVAKVNIKSSAMIRMGSYKVRNFYISLLYHLIFQYDKFTTKLKNEGFGIIITDHRFTLRIDFNDPEFEEKYPSSKIFLKELFLNLKRMRMGMLEPLEDADLETVIKDDGTIDSTNAVMLKDTEDIDDTVITKTMEIVDQMKTEENPEADEAEQLADKIATELTEEETPVKKKEVKETKKERDLKEAAQKITDIVKKDQKRNISIPMRLETVEKKQQAIMDENLEEVLKRLEDIAESMLKPDVVETKNKFGTFSINKMDKQYTEIAKKDRLDIAESLNHNSVPLYLTNYKDEENMTSKDTYARKVQMTFESPHNNKEKHTFTLNVPELRDGKFLHINGSDKVIIRQKIALPIIRLTDGVVMTSYYGKMFMGLTNANLSKTVARVKSFIKLLRKKFPNTYLKKWFNFTPAFYVSKDQNVLSPEMLEISRFITSIFFNEETWIDLSAEDGYIACVFGELYRSNQSEDKVTNIENGTELTVLELFDKVLGQFSGIENDEGGSGGIYDLWNTKNTGATSNNISYSKIDRWPGGSTPTIYLVLHAMDENLLSVLDVLKNNYNLIYDIVPRQGDKLPKSKFQGDNCDRFIFGNFALDVKYGPISNRHLLQPLHNVDLTTYDSLRLTGIIQEVTNSSNVIMAMETYEDLFWDPITKKVMDDCGMPNDFAESLIYANHLLTNYDRTVSEISLKNERMPSNAELIQGAMYACIAKEYRDYSIKVKRGSKSAHFSVQQDAVITYLATLPNVEESSKINSIQHVDKLYTVSSKGISGVNNSRSYTTAKRKWDKSFYGIMSDVSPYGPGTGITKHLAMNPNIKDVRGYFVTKDPADTSPDEIMAVSEALRPFTQRHDSSPRTAMSMMQANHLMGTEGSEPAYITYGMDETLASLDSDFSKRAKDTGRIIMITDRFIKVQYDNLKHEDGSAMEEVLDLDVIERNSAKAFYTPNKMIWNETLGKAKVGLKFKENDILVYNSNFYQTVGDEVVFKSGPIVNIALMNTQYAYEDATVMSESLAKRLQTKVLKRIAVKLSPRNQIKFVRTTLGPIAAGDDLIKISEDTGSDFLNRSYDLSALEDSLLKVEKSNYNGTLRDIFIYYKLTESDEKAMDKTIKSFMNTVDAYYKNDLQGADLAKNLPAFEQNRVIDHVTKFTDNRKNTVNGDLINKGEILVEFFIEVNQNFSSGDKITIGNTALKGVGSKIFTDDQAPIGQTTGRKIDLILSTYGPLSRMIYSTFLIGPLTAAMEKINNDIMDIIKNDK